MYKKYKSKQKTVAEKVADLIVHPNESETDEETPGIEEIAKPPVAEFDEDEYELPHASITEFKKKNMKLLSEQSARYKGKITSRKELEADSSENDSEEENEQSVYESSDTDEQAFANESKIEDGNSSSDEMHDETEMSEATEESEDAAEDDNHVISEVNRAAEIQKGFCVQNQLRIWERLLELRMHSQKILTKLNQLPKPQEIQDSLKKQQNSNDIIRPSLNLLNQLIVLQDSFTNQFSELNKVMKTGNKRSYPFAQDEAQSEPPLKQINQFLQERFETFRSYRNETLLKWEDRTKLLNPGARGKKQFASEDHNIIKKIGNVLMNKTTLIKKSQQLKSNEHSGESANNDPMEKAEIISNPNIYDDSDFYHQQLRELIEYKANTTTSLSEVTKQFAELQKIRQKMKKKVDTRASKGRKIRYVVHNKLINFMAPHDNTSWSEESKNELFKSLFV
uniref:Apoptosis antagonizing transcription factor/protein transport protein n=1 Tax=Glossina brevipalpis TaxID=37001 RepID=A0A1A9VZY3_9MUSC